MLRAQPRSLENGRASGYRALYSALEAQRVSLNIYARLGMQKDECRRQKSLSASRLASFCILPSALNWNPVLESHQPLRLCRPPPELLGQRDESKFNSTINGQNFRGL